MILLLGACNPPEGQEEPPVSELGEVLGAVDPFIATGGPGFRVGSSTPAAGLPFGLVKVGPDTSLDWGGVSAYHCSGYYYTDPYIEGFSHLHLHGVGVADYGDILFMPTLGWDPSKRDEDGYRITYAKDSEWAAPGSYGVTLDDGIGVTLAATAHAAQHAYVFPDRGDPVVVIDLEHNLYGSNLGGSVTVDAERGVVEGYMTNQGSFTGAGFPVWFSAVFDDGIASYGTWADDEGEEGRAEAAGVDLGAWIVPATSNPTIRVGISLTSLEGARANLDAELPAQPIADTVQAAADAWDEQLAAVRIAGATDEQRTIFYTALFHAYEMPQDHGDVDGTYRGFDNANHAAEGWTYLDDLSLWDTYRTANPLYALLQPDRARDIARSLLAMGEQGGAYPRWPAAAGDSGSMLGAPADIVFADTFVKGIADTGIEDAWAHIRAQARGEGDIPYNARPDVATLERYGYYPGDQFGASVAWLEEDAWADHALAQLAGALGEDEDAAHFAWRSYTWRNAWDPAVGFFHARLSDGSFDDDFDEFAWLDDYTEGNAWQYLWMPWFHPDALMETMGGHDAAVAKLDTFFDEAEKEGVLDFPQTYYWHGNEPDIHAAWLYTLWGERDRTWKWVRWVADTHYAVDPAGLAGNDDAGTLSAWYVFAALGFYPIAGTTSYVAGVPLFSEVEIPVEGGTFTSKRIGEGDHVKEVRLNGRPLDGPTFQHHQLVAGGSYEVVVE